jgi:hypothetical protein
MIQVMLGDRQRLEQHVEDWKIIAEQCEEKKLELDRVVRKVLLLLLLLFLLTSFVSQRL